MPVSLYTGVPLLEKAEVQRSNNLFTSLNLTIKALPAESGATDYKILNRQIVFGMSCQVGEWVIGFV